MEKGKYGFIDSNGKVIIPAQYDNTTGMYEGMAAVEVCGKWGFIDLEGKTVIQPQYEKANFFSEGLAYVTMKGKNGFVDKMGHLKINLGDSTSTYFSEGMAPVVKGSKVGFINKRGTIVIQPRYGLEDSATHFQNGYAIVDEGFIDKAGRRLITDRDYTLFRDNDNFCNGLASVWANGNTGYIDVKGNTVIEGIGGRQFSEGLAAALKDGMFGYIDTNGDFVIEPQFGKAELFSEDLAFVVFKTNESKCGYIDRSGKLVIELKWRYGMEFTNGVALVYNTDTATNQWGYIDKRGNYVWKNFK